MKNKTRKTLLNYIQNHPGVPFGRLKDIFDLTDGTLRYHLGYLEKKGEVKSRFKGGKKIFYPTKMAAPARGKGTSRNQARMISVIERDPGITKRQLYQATNISKRELDRELRKLCDRGLIKRAEDEDGYVGFELVSEKDMQKEVFKLLVIKLIRKEIDEETFNYLREELENSSD